MLIKLTISNDLPNRNKFMHYYKKDFRVRSKPIFSYGWAACTHPGVCKNRDFCMRMAHPHVKIGFSRAGAYVARTEKKSKKNKIKKNENHIIGCVANAPGRHLLLGVVVGRGRRFRPRPPPADLRTARCRIHPPLPPDRHRRPSPLLDLGREGRGGEGSRIPQGERAAGRRIRAGVGRRTPDPAPSPPPRAIAYARRRRLETARRGEEKERRHTRRERSEEKKR